MTAPTAITSGASTPLLHEDVDGMNGSTAATSSTSSTSDLTQLSNQIKPSQRSSADKHKQPFQLTPEALEKQRLRKEAKLAAAAAKLKTAGGDHIIDKNAQQGLSKDGSRRLIITRRWLDLVERKEISSENSSSSTASDSGRLRILSWNMLAQTLVRRKLFPGSDCLKWKDRQEGLAAELKAYPADVIALQEVDRMDVILPQLEPSLGFKYAQVAAKGRGKSHGCVVLYREGLWEYKSHKVVVYDKEEIWNPHPDQGAREAADRRRARGGTRRTTNIGLIVALKRKGGGGGGLVIATTHLFWHPDFSYERARQVLILCKHVLAYRSQMQQEDQEDSSSSAAWEAILAGDFNSQPSEPGYHLVTSPSVPFTQAHREILDRGRVVHDSLDKLQEALEAKSTAANTECAPAGEDAQTVNASGAEEGGDEEEEGGEGDEDEEDPEEQGASDADADPTLPKSCRRPTDEDGLPTADELQAMARDILGPEGLKSSYGSSNWPSIDLSYRALTFGGREGGGSTSDSAGATDEPNWSSFTPLWRLQLDYIFAFPSARLSKPPVKLLLPHRTDDMEPGLPRKTVCASDHVLIGAEYEL